jgi:signal transduction histidine kinase
MTTWKLPPYSRSDSTRILSLCADRNDRVWVGGSFKIAKGVDGKSSYINAPYIEPGAAVHAIAEDAVGNLWVTVWEGGKGGGVLRLRDGNWTDFRKSSGLPNFRCRVLYGDPQGRVWLGFEDGGVAVDEDNEFRVYSSKHGLPGGRVLAISADREGRIWVAEEGGLSRFDRGHFVTLTNKNGLPGISVSAIVEDNDGFFWLAGAVAILLVSPQELEKALLSPSYRMQGASFDATDGLRGLPRQREPFPTAARASDGRLWFSTTEGVAIIDPRHLPRNLVPPPVTIEAIKADRRQVAISSGLDFRPNTKDLEFDYAALSLVAPERVRFRYKLEGYDDDWRGPVTVRTVTYTNLPPRNYRFRVVACNNDGVWNEEGATLDFKILPAFYQTNWFLLLCIAAAGYLVWAAYRWRIRQVAAGLHSQFEARLAERTMIAQDLHDTLLQGFLSAAMQLDVADGHLPADSSAKPIVGRVLELMRNVADDSRKAVWGLRSPHRDSDDLEKVFSRISREFAAQHAIDYRVIVEGHARPLHPVIGDEVCRIGREALANAFRHSQASRIEVELGYAANQLRVLIRDNGCGIDPQVLRSGRDGHWGLLGMRERAARIGARFKVWSRAAGGTEVELSVPGDAAFQSNSSGRGLPWFSRLRPPKAGHDIRKQGVGPAK